MNNIIKKILYTLTVTLQLATIVGVCVVQYLTNKKAGVMHHVYYRKYQFENSIFSPENLLIQKNIAIVLIIIFFVIFIYLLKKNKNIFYKVQAGLTFISSFLIYISMSSRYFTEKLAYHYFIMAFVLVFIIQFIVFVITSIHNKNPKNNYLH